MIIVMQCAGRKNRDAFLRNGDGRRVCFVADPDEAPPGDFLYGRPDDFSDSGLTWRTLLLAYNQAGTNPLGLAEAYRLYSHPSYQALAERVGPENLYILSAGWGLIASTFLTPYYDITFAAQAPDFKRRRKSHLYQDFRMLPSDTNEPVVFFGSKDYAPLFASLTEEIRAPKTVFYNSAKMPRMPGCLLVPFAARIDRNWQYECVQAFLDGTLDIPFDSD